MEIKTQGRLHYRRRNGKIVAAQLDLPVEFARNCTLMGGSKLYVVFDPESNIITVCPYSQIPTVKVV